jgi:menaquinol-cytochrome c reductase iron-sulfur subunit
VQYKDGDQKYVCPCHDSAFNVDGTRNNEIPPRDLDTLEVKKDDSGTVWVKFQKFRAGTSEKKPV